MPGMFSFFQTEMRSAPRRVNSAEKEGALVETWRVTESPGA